MKKRILVINLGWEQETLLERLSQQSDLEIFGIHSDNHYTQTQRYKDILVSSLRDLDKILHYAEKIKPDAIISDQCDYSYFAQALLAEHFHLPGPGMAAAQVAVNKLLQRQYAQAAGILCPEFKACLSIEQAHEFAEHIGYPVIVKPVDNRGSFGVSKVESPEELPASFRDAVIHSHSRWVIVERYIQGRHLTVDGYHFQGRAVSLALATKDKLAGKRGIIDGCITYPGELSEDIYQQALRNAENTAQALGFQFGYFHGEFMLTEDNQIYLTEMANRGGGVFTSEIIVPEVSGLDVVGTYIQDVLGQSTPAPTQIARNPVRMKFFELSHLQGKTISNIRGVREIRDLPHVLALRMLIHKGDKISVVNNGGQRHGVLVVKAPQVSDLDTVLEQTIEHLVVEHE